MEKIVVSDTNIFIDLISVNLLDGFFGLPWEIHTTDMIMKELKDSNQKSAVETFMQQGRLKLLERETWGGLTPLREMSSLITQRRFSDMLWRYWD